MTGLLRRHALALVLLALAGTAASKAEAGLVIDIQQVGADVVATGSGTVDLAGLTFSFSSSVGDAAAVGGAVGGVAMGPAVYILDDIYTGVSGPTSFGAGPIIFATSGSGDTFGVNGTFAVVGVPLGYVSGTPLLATDTYSGQTLSSLGLTPGTYTFTFGTGDHADSIVVNIGIAAVPEPSTLAGAALIAVALARYLRHKRAA
jgi:hypothetical protein